MKNKYVIILLVVCQLVLICPVGFSAEEQEIQVQVDGVNVNFDVAPFEQNDRILVPFRAIAEALELRVIWDETTETVTTSGQNTEIVFQVGKDEAEVDGRKYLLDGAILEKEGRTFVPVRFISQHMGADVKWDDTSRTVKITTCSEKKEDPQMPWEEPQLKEAPQVPAPSPEPTVPPLHLAKDEASLLDGRLAVKVPPDVTGRSLQNSIMSAQPSSHELTRLTFAQERGGTVQIWAQELFVFTSGSLKEDAQKMAEEVPGLRNREFQVSSFETDHDLEAVRMDVTQPEVENDAILISGVIVKMPDNMLVYVGVYFDKTAYEQPAVCEKVADGRLKSLRLGTRRWNLVPHDTQIAQMRISLKQDYILIRQLGVDFTVYYVVKVVPAGEKTPQMGLYIGGWPSYSETEYGFERSEMKRIPDVIRGQDVEWLFYQKEDDVKGERAFMQCLVPYASYELGQDETYYEMLHLFITPSNLETLEEMREMAKSLADIEESKRVLSAR